MKKYLLTDSKFALCGLIRGFVNSVLKHENEDVVRVVCSKHPTTVESDDRGGFFQFIILRNFNLVSKVKLCIWHDFSQEPCDISQKKRCDVKSSGILVQIHQ